MSRAVLLLGVLAALLLGWAPPATAQQPAAEVVVVGVPGLRWDDVDATTTPALHALAGSSAVGALSVKAVPALSCPADGWLTLGAGNRAAAFGLACDELDADLGEQARRNLATRQQADIGALAEALRGAGGCLSGQGAGPDLAGAGLGSACPVHLVAGPAVGGADRVAAAAATDRVVAGVVAARGSGPLLVVGLSGAPGDDVAHLHVALARGPGFEPGALRSASTRRSPFVQLVDVAPTVLELLGVPAPASMTGEPWRVAGAAPTVAALTDLDRRAVAADQAIVPFFVVAIAALLLGCGLAAWRRSWRLAETMGLGFVAALAGSYLAGAVPWWRAPAPLLALLAAAGVAAVGLALAARRLPGAVTPAGAVCGVLAVLLGLDLLTGARLQIDTPAGYSPLVAGRFAGLGNVAFGVYAGAVLLALAAATSGRGPRPALAVVATGGVLAVLLDGAPSFGSDVGGVLALVPAVVLLALLRSGGRVSVARLAVAGLAGTLVVAGFALADWTRPAADRTHLGRFVEQVVDGSASVVLRRKGESVLDLLFANPVTALLPLLVAAAVLVVVRPPAPLRAAFATAPAWRHGLLAVGVASAVGFVANDSGPAVPALALLVAGPGTLAVVARVAARRAQPDPAAP